MKAKRVAEVALQDKVSFPSEDSSLWACEDPSAEWWLGLRAGVQGTSRWPTSTSDKMMQ